MAGVEQGVTEEFHLSIDSFRGKKNLLEFHRIPIPFGEFHHGADEFRGDLDAGQHGGDVAAQGEASNSISKVPKFVVFWVVRFAAFRIAAQSPV